jgi:hypothetical protein
METALFAPDEPVFLHGVEHEVLELPACVLARAPQPADRGELQAQALAVTNLQEIVRLSSMASGAVCYVLCDCALSSDGPTRRRWVLGERRRVS